MVGGLIYGQERILMADERKKEFIKKAIILGREKGIFDKDDILDEEEIDIIIDKIEGTDTSLPDKPKISFIQRIKEHFNLKRTVVYSFLLPPIIISVISMMHLWEFFIIANNNWMAFLIAISFELIAISSLVALMVLDRIEKGALWTLFFLVALYQIIGNVYASYINIPDSLVSGFINMFWLKSWSIQATKQLIAIIQGAALPILSLSLIKLAVDYFDWETDPLLNRKK